MNKYSSELPKFQKTVLKTLWVILLCILRKEEVNMNKLKNEVGLVLGKKKAVQSSSHYRYLTRFFCHPFCQQILWKQLLWCISQEVQLLISKLKGSKYLVLDGTSWQIGSRKIHLLTLSFVYKGVSIPLFFMDLEKKGCSNAGERFHLLTMASKIFPIAGMTLLADREYVGEEWFIALIERFSLNFIIRICRLDYKKQLEKQGLNYEKLLAKARKGKKVLVKLQLGTHTFNLLFQRIDKPESKDDDLLILLYNQNIGKNSVAKVYELRWTIECMFKNLKSNGFKMENLNFKCPKKIRLLIAMLAVIYFICIRFATSKKSKIYFRKNSKNNDVSIFREGINLIAYHSSKLDNFLNQIIRLIQYLQPKMQIVQ